MKKKRLSRRQRRAAQLARRRRYRNQAARQDDDRRGSVIVVVIALLTALMVLGFFVFTMARQEKENAEYFKQASKRLVPLDFDPDTVFDCFLHDFILGPPPDHYQSPLWGGHISLLPTMFGTDIQPFNGEGVHAVWNNWNPGPDGAPGIAQYDDDGDGIDDNPTEFGAPRSDDFPMPNGGPISDMNYDGVPDVAPNADVLLQLNQSPAAQGAIYDQAGVTDGRRRPEMDVDYTYPDHTNPFLTYIGVVPIHDPRVGTVFVMPAFHRPQLMRGIVNPQLDPTTNPFGVFDGTNPPSPAAPNFFTHPNTAARCLVPHAEHRIVQSDGTVTSQYRFVSGTHPDTLPVSDPAYLAPFDGHLGVYEQAWRSSAANITGFDYPVDPTRKGLNNAFYIDCGFGLQEDPTTGETFVPLIAVTVLDAESLFNLNVHGNTSLGLDANVSLTNAAGMSSQMLSQSHQGVSRAEINPTWGLNAIADLNSNGGDFTGTQADLDAALEQYRFYYGSNPIVSGGNPSDGGDLPLFRHMANMDLWNLLHGRPQFDSSAGIPGSQADIQELYAGRYGEESVLFNAILPARAARSFPWAGASSGANSDDNGDGQRVINDLHPIDFFGTGYSQQWPPPASASQFARLFYTSRHRYPRYLSYYTTSANRYSSQTVPNIPGTQLVNIGANPPTGVPLVNEPEEMLLETDLAAGSSNDRFFDASQNALLQLPDFDLITNGLSGRVLNLAPFNFFANDRAEQIRSRFTTLSSEPLSYQTVAKIPEAQAPAAWQRAGSNFDQNHRTWEHYDATSGAYRFPPQFVDVTSGTPAPVPLSYVPATNGPGTFNYNTPDPFRNELRELLFTSALDGNSFRRLMRRLELNRVLDRNPNNGDLRFRPLTPHPTNLGAAPIPERTVLFGGNPPVPESIAGNVQRQEFLARHDRQRLARDIFVLLYTLGGKDNINYSSTSNPYGFDPADPTSQPELLRMAQFAVNMVDAFDFDDVVTKFEFDFDLSNGWQLDDDPYGDPSGDTNPGDRFVVFGQEEQSLCFNEALAVFAKKVPDNSGSGETDHPLTEWDDRSSRQFVFLELENVSSRAVRFDSKRSWRIVTRFSDPAIGTESYFYPKEGTSPSSPWVGTGTNSRLTIGSSNTDTLIASGNFPALSSDGETSRLRIKTDPAATTVDPIAPANMDGTMDFDLRKRTNAFDLEDSGGTDISNNGKNLLSLNLNQLETAGATGHTVEFIIQRRADTTRAEVDVMDEDDNPWIVVDRFRTELRSLELVEDDDTLSEMQTKVEDLLSTERIQPLIGRPESPNEGQMDADLQGAMPYRASSIGEDNTQEDMVPFTMWHPHFNREFVSTAELFNVPLYGPQPIGEYDDPYNSTALPELTFSIAGDNPPQGAIPTEKSTFGYYVLNPDNETVGPPPPPPGLMNVTDDDNRWYRILEYIKLSTRQDLDPFRTGVNPYVTNLGRSGDDAGDVVFRNHGPINLNMLRHSEVLAGLLDEKEMLSQVNIQTALPILERPNSTFQRRDWFYALALARDRNDPVLGVANGVDVPVPGIPGISKPFRSLSNFDGGLRSLENTMLRKLLYWDSITDFRVEQDPRQMFEIGALQQHNNELIDYTTKHKLLGKLLNHGTTLSNTFFVFMQVDLFSARDVAPAGQPPQVRIGAKLPNSPGYRSFVVIDRGLALDMVQPTDLPPLNVPNTTPPKQVFSFNQNFNWRALIVHRRRLN